MPPTTPRIITLGASCQIMAASAGNSKRGTFEGVAYSGGTMRLAGWNDPVVLDLEGLEGGADIGVLANHRADIMALLGQASATVANGSVIVAGRLVPGTPEADRAIAFRAEGLKVPISIGATPTRVEYVPAGKSAMVNGREFAGPVDIIRASKIDEISVVGLGADGTAFAQVAAQKRNPMPPEDSTIQTASGSTLAERDRIRDIRAAFRDLNSPDAERECDRLIDEGASVEHAQREALRLLRAHRPTTSGVRTGGRHGSDREVLIAAVLAHGGAGDIAERRFTPQVMERADTLRMRAGSIMGIARESLRLAGRPEPGNQSELIQASFSTDALGGVLQTAISIVALEAFRTADEPWRALAHRTPLADFKENTLTRLAGSFRFQPVGKGGELKHSSLDSETTKIRLGTSGSIISITRQTIIDDSASQLLTQVPQELAREAARVVGDDLIGLLSDGGGDFFTTERGNLLDGAGTGLSIQSLAVAISRLRKQKDSSGRALNLSPAYLLVGAELESAGRVILNSAEIASVTAEDTPSGNPHKGVAELLVDARLGDNEWYLFSAPKNAGAVVGLLNGADNPVVEQKETSAEVLGQTWRAYFDYGVALHEWRAIVKSTGGA